MSKTSPKRAPDASEPARWRIRRDFQADHGRPGRRKAARSAPRLLVALGALAALAPLPAAPARAQTACDGVEIRWRDGAREARAVRCGGTRVELRDERTVARAEALPEAMIELPRGTPDVERALRALELEPVRPLARRRALWLVRSAVRGEDGLDVAARLAPQVRTGALVLASPDLGLAHRAAAIDVPPDDPMFGAQWYLSRIGILDAWALATGDAATTISVVDDGCDLLHADLAPHLLPGADVFDGDDDPSYAPGVAGNAHGTSCAGIAGAVGDDGLGIAGACPECTLRCVRLLGESGAPIPLSADVRAFELAIEWGVSVVSNSWGFVDAIVAPAALATAIEAVFTEGRGGRGALVVFAAGNDDREIFDYEIQALRGVINVGAIRSRDEATSFSNRGPSVDLVAPTGTVTTDISGPDGSDPGDYTALFGGTSSSAPVVSGVAALLFSAVPEATASEVHDALIAGVRPAPYAMPDATGHDPLYGYGVVDPAASLRILLSAHGRLDAGVPDRDAAGDVDAGAASAPAPGGCACRAGSSATATPAQLGVLALAAWIAARRRRAR